MAAIEVERATTKGIANPNACGQAIMNTVTIRSSASGKFSKNNQAIKAKIPATNAT